ncbi:MAG: reductase [Nocardioidaceae bacterium]|nr:reductase [Nocardioidaceae bacterium]
MTFTIAVVTAGLSEPSSSRLLADRLSAAVTDQLRSAGHDTLVEVVELRPLAHALADNLLTGFPSGALAAAISTVTNADALIAVTPIFSASYAGLFKLFFDVLDNDALTGKPTLIGATAGTARHSLALEHAVRPLFTYLRAVVVPTAVFAATEDFGAHGNTLGARIQRAATELVSLLAPRQQSRRAQTFGQSTPHPPAGQQPPRAPADPFGDVIPFDQLLRGNP